MIGVISNVLAVVLGGVAGALGQLCAAAAVSI